MRVKSLSRLRSGTLIVLLLSSLIAIAQTHPTFTRQQYPGGDGTTLFTADLNQDGVLDVLQPSSGHFVVIISNGNGTWQTPKNVAYPSGFGLTTSLFAADVNNDGKVDVVIGSTQSNTIAVYPGNGDGSFGAPKLSTIAAAAGTRFEMVSGADFNHDGKIDLIVAADIPGIDIPTGAYYLITGNGTTSFSTAKQIFAGHYAWSNIAIGDFDADSNADVAITDASACSPKHCAVLLHILFGNGDLGFTTVNPSLETSDFEFGSGDVNNDGKTDLFGTGAASHSYVVYGRTDRAMTITEVIVPSFSSFRRPAIADLNGDGRNDVAGTRFRSTTNDYTLLTLLRRTDGTFAAVDSVFFGSTPPGNSVATGDFNKDTKPDLLVKTSSTTSAAQTLNELLNTTSGDFGGCSYPSAGQGIHICKPTATTTSPVTFNASANSFQPIRKLELWIDGKKVTEQFHVWDKRAWFRSTQSLAAGTHRATFIAANPDNTLLRSSLSFTVSGLTCTPSSATGTVICSPANGTTVSNPVTASAKGGSSVKNMEIWVDGTRRAVSSGNSISATLTLSAGGHKLTAFSKNGSTVLSSAVSNFTVR